MFTPVLCWCCNYILHRGLHIVYFFSVALVIIICPGPLYGYSAPDRCVHCAQTDEGRSGRAVKRRRHEYGHHRDGAYRCADLQRPCDAVGQAFRL